MTLGGAEEVRRRAEEEAQFHVEMREAEYVEQGMEPAEAARRARRDFGNVTLIQEQTGDLDMLLWLEGWMRDARVAMRRLRKSPVFLATSVALLAVGIGLNAAVFSMLDVLFLKPLPFAEQEQLVVLQETNEGKPANSNPVRLRDWAARVPGIAGLTSSYGDMTVLQRPEGNDRVITLRTVGDYWGVFRLQAKEGRLYGSGSEARNQAVLTERGRRLGKVGDTLRLGGAAYEVVGIVGNEAGNGEEVDVLTPIPAGVGESRKAGFLVGVARMKPGVGVSQLQEQAGVVARQLAVDYPETDAKRGVMVKGLLEAMTGEARETGAKIQGAVGVLLLICVLNLAGLFAARSVERQKESLVRRSLGADAWQVLRLQVVEAGLVTLMGIGGALVVARWSLQLLKAQFAEDLSLLERAELDWRVGGVLGVVAVFCVGVFSVVMALESTREQKVQGEKAIRLRSGILVLQAALGVLLLGFGLQVVGDVMDIQGRALGFRSQGVVFAKVDLPWDLSNEKLLLATQEGLAALRAIPGVADVALTDRLPMEGGTQSGPVMVDGRVEKMGDDVGFRMVTPNYFEVMGVPLLSGGKLGEKESVVVNEEFARRFLGGSAVGKTVSRDGKRWWRVVGIVGNLRVSPKDAEVRAEVFLRPEDLSWPKLVYVFKTGERPSAIEKQAKEVWARIQPVASVAGAGMVEERVEKSLAEPKRRRDVAAMLGLVALLLVVSGVYGLMAGEVVRRTKEIGIRLAIGASEWEVFGLVLQRAWWMGTVAALLGGAVGWWLTGKVYGWSALIVVTAMVVAAVQPAWRLKQVQPSVALRSE